MSLLNRGSRSAVLAACLLTIIACTPQQVQQAQQDQAIVQAVLNAGCTNPALQAALAALVPGGNLACVGGVVGAGVVTAVMNDPALVAKVEALHK